MKIVALYDIHTPMNILLKPVFHFIHDFKPDTVVLGGDISDFESASHWIANQGSPFDLNTIQEDYQHLHKIVLIPLKAAAPKAKVIYLRGNHESWLDQTIALNRNGRGFWELENNIDLRKFNMKILEVNQSYTPTENLTYIHGVYTGMYHARQTVQAYHQSVLYGHVHDVQTYIQVSPINSKHFYKASSVGCLCTLNPHWMKNKPNRWVNGFNYVYINDNGSFHDVQVIIVRGGFWANEKYYF